MSAISNNFILSCCLLSLYKKFWIKDFFRLVLRNLLLESSGLSTSIESWLFSDENGSLITSWNPFLIKILFIFLSLVLIKLFSFVVEIKNFFVSMLLYPIALAISSAISFMLVISFLWCPENNVFLWPRSSVLLL